MAGRGQRFVDAGYDCPKPLIDVAGIPMYARATMSMPLSVCTRLIFICLEDHLGGGSLSKDIDDRFSQYSPVIVPLRGVTEGQACTVLEAREYIDSEIPLLIFNADTQCETDLDTVLPDLKPEIDGLFGVFEAQGDMWSFARVDSSGMIVETAEKRRISKWASTGLYHFRSGRTFLRGAQAMIKANDRVNGEFYVAPIYNHLIEAGGKFQLNVALNVWPLGTPEDLARFLADPTKG